MNRLWLSLRAVFVKEWLTISRDRFALFLMFGIPSLQLVLFGYAINADVTRLPTAVLDLDRGAGGRAFLQALENTGTFSITRHVDTLAELESVLQAGRAKVGVVVPRRFTERRQASEPAQVQLLIDGSNSTVATTAMQSGTALGLQLSVESAGERLRVRGILTGERLQPSVEVRPRLLFNPDLKSSYFFVPGLIGVILQIIPVFLTAFAIVREREGGTLEQLLVTPLPKIAIITGKLVPYLVVGFVELAFILTVMWLLFRVPIAGSLVLLILLSGLFILCSLAIGLLISTVARTQPQALQLSYMMMLPSILLSGFLFPRESMPVLLQGLSLAFPVTHFLEILRGIILRGAGFRDLWPQTLILGSMMVILVGLSVRNFRKTLE